MVRRFNFLIFGDALATLEERFEEYCRMVLRNALEHNADQQFPLTSRTGSCHRDFAVFSAV